MAAPKQQPLMRIRELVAEASVERTHERRVEKRYPFFCPVSISPSSAQRQKFSAFSREISLSGIGLLHNMLIEREEVSLSVYRDGAAAVELRAEIMWCRPCGEGWYLSGARFIMDAE